MGWGRRMGWILGSVLILILGGMAYVRLSPVDAARWHLPPPAERFAALADGQVQAETGGALLHLGPARGAPADVLARLDAIALATPRTTRLAGSADSGMITWQTRSALWGFPDYTTALAGPDGVQVWARLRFGREDMGVNARRLQDWLGRL